MSETHRELVPNDVAVILRPKFEEDGKWHGEFEVLVTGFGPITMTKEQMDDMIGMGVLLASVVPYMEHDPEFVDKLGKFCNEFYGDIDFNYNPNHNSFGGEFTLTPDTKTEGGMQ